MRDLLSTIRAARASAGGYVPAHVVNEIVAGGQPVDQLMMELLPLAKEFAVPPISNFYVGAVALGVSGNLYFGANYEFPGQALSFTVHAEQAVTTHAMSWGERGLAMLAVSAAPCGYCRQFLNELTTAAMLQIITPGGEPVPFSSLLPNAFGPVDLDVSAALMSPQSHGLTLASPADAITSAALAAANASYAPYSRGYAGVALATDDGAIFTGSVAENAAFNPGMSPLEAAIVSLAINGGKRYADIVDAVLVEVPNATASQAGATSAVLETITKVPLRVINTVE
jgi:cytidine deaminase